MTCSIVLRTLFFMTYCGHFIHAFLLSPPSCHTPKNTNAVLRRHSFVTIGSKSRYSNNLYNEQEDNNNSDDVLEALQSLSDYHEGSWNGRARSFVVTDDVAAGIVRRKQSVPYTTRVRLDMDAQDFVLQETMEWGECSVGHCTLRLKGSNVDVDAVDASYSLDATLPDFPPAAIAGTLQPAHFVIQHCIATNDDERVRCFVMYGMDQSLLRVVVCEEERVTSNNNLQTESEPQQRATSGGLSTVDLLELQSDVDHLVSKVITKTTTPLSRLDQIPQVSKDTSSETSDVATLSRHPISLLDVSSGVWLGDAVVREMETSPTFAGKGFGAVASPAPSFASWTVGVQKCAWRWMWNFEQEIRQVNDIGKSLGATLNACLGRTFGGSVCVNESLSRRIAKDERMVMIDWDGDTVGFLTGSCAIQVPRHLQFDGAREQRSFYTEFSVFQIADSPSKEDVETQLPDIVCSKMARVYNIEGHLQQGSTSFFTLKRFGGVVDDDGEL
jgi:hypothetical protein